MTKAVNWKAIDAGRDPRPILFDGNKLMRAVVVILVILLILGLVGWIQFGSPEGDPGIRIDTEKVEQDTSEMVEGSKRAIGNAAEKIDESINRDAITE